MAVDIRATVTCSLGTLISASISDDYIQGSGLIKTKGNCELSGLYNPPPGTVVTFAYTKNGVTRAVPRKMRVLSSFADPFRRTTRVELGCKLTYLQDLKDPIKWNAFNDPLNSQLDANDAIVTLPIYASSVAGRCLFALGISSSTLSLTNRFSIAEFDFSAGYVNVLSDLLVSESYCGYLDYTEKLQVFPLWNASFSGPVVDQGNLIDIGPIGMGELAGDAVVVSYSSLKLKAPDNEEVVCRYADEEQTDEDNWGGNDFAKTSSQGRSAISYKPPGAADPLIRTYTWQESTVTSTTYSRFDVYGDGSVRLAGSGGYAFPDDADVAPELKVVEQRRLVINRSTTYRTGSAAIAGGIITSRLNAGLDFNNFDVYKTTTESFAYDSKGNERLRVAETYGSLLFQYGAVGLPTTFTNPDGSVSSIDAGQGTGYLEKIEVISITTNGKTKRVTRRYGPWAETLSGQQSIAEASENFTTVAQVQDYLNFALGGLYLLDVTTEFERTGQSNAQELPAEADVTNEQYADDGGDPNNGYSTESSSELELVTGSPLATRRIELSMPYAPDDTFVRQIVSTSPLRYCYYSRKSDAEQKARLYGLTQNRILFGNRNGMNIQTVPELIPNAPFGPFYVSANGAVSQYRTNGTSWTMDSNGIVASTDALYWGVAGQAP